MVGNFASTTVLYSRALLTVNPYPGRFLVTEPFVLITTSCLLLAAMMFCLLETSQATYMLDALFCFVEPWLASCLSTTLCFFDCFKE